MESYKCFPRANIEHTKLHRELQRICCSSHPTQHTRHRNIQITEFEEIYTQYTQWFANAMQIVAVKKKKNKWCKNISNKLLSQIHFPIVAFYCSNCSSHALVNYLYTRNCIFPLYSNIQSKYGCKVGIFKMFFLFL